MTIDDNHPRAALGARIVHFGEALIRWGRSGFATVERSTFERRLAACGSCPNRLDASPGLVSRLVGAGADRLGLCILCGCVIERKALIATEACPERAPDTPHLTRWGDPLG